MKKKWQECWDSGKEIYVLLKGSDTLEGARVKIVNYLEALDWTYRRDLDKISSWNYFLFKESIRCIKNIISLRNERFADNSSLEILWNAARTGKADVTDDFIDEFVHLFKAIKGKSNVYPSQFLKGIEPPDFDYCRGREAALKRSDYLDQMGLRMNEFLVKYPSGLTPEVKKKRARNKTRILKQLGATDEDWADWKWQFENVFKDKNGLKIIEKIIKLKPEEKKGIALAIENDVPFGVTPYYLHLMDRKPNGLDSAVRKQVFPPPGYVETMIAHKEDRQAVFDFMRECDTSPLKLVTRRYPKVAIIKPYDSCPQICVYCQRNWEITSPFMKEALAPKEQIDSAIDWFAEHDQIMDVLLTGGDPLVMDDNLIDYILSRFSQIPHIQNIRIATRMPITVPQRITKDLCEIFSRYYQAGKQTLCLVTHISHPYEITLETAKAIKRIKMTGMHVYNQQVFTFWNSRRFESVALRTSVKQIGIDPYYCFNMKGKSEIEEYAVPVARILQERKEEARLLPGIFRTDEAVFNVPLLGKNHLRGWQDHELISILPDGRRVYSFHPWEKNITRVMPYIYTDVPIGKYLEEIKKRGENPEDYKSIWYYY